MKLIKNGIVKQLTDKETIRIFLDAGWEEVQEVKVIEKVETTEEITEEPIVETPRKASKNRNK